MSLLDDSGDTLVEPTVSICSLCRGFLHRLVHKDGRILHVCEHCDLPCFKEASGCVACKTAKEAYR